MATKFTSTDHGMRNYMEINYYINFPEVCICGRHGSTHTVHGDSGLVMRTGVGIKGEGPN